MTSYADSHFSVLLPVGLLTVGALLALLLEVARPALRRLATPVSIAALAGAAACLYLVDQTAPGGPSDALSREVGSDVLTLAFAPAFFLAALASLLLAGPLLRRMNRERGEFQALVLFSTAGMVLVTQARDLLVFFLAIETLSIPLYVLAGFLTAERRSVEAALKYFTVGAFASAFLAFGIALTYGATGSLSFELVHEGLGAAVAEGSAARVLLGRAGLACVLAGLAFKVGLVPFHAWAPDVYQGAPTSVTTLLAVGSKAAGFAALLRLLLGVFGVSPAVTCVLAVLAAASMVVGSCAAMLQDDLKRLLAYSGISHAGFMAMALAAHGRLTEAGTAVNGPLAFVSSPAAAAVMFYAVSYALMTTGILTLVAMGERRHGDGTAILDMQGLATRRPLLAGALLAFLLSLGGMPPMAGFMAKWLTFRVAVEGGLFWLAVVAALASVVGFFYYLRIVLHAYLRPPREGVADMPTPPRSQLLLVVACVAGTVVLGLLPWLLLSRITTVIVSATETATR